VAGLLVHRLVARFGLDAPEEAVVGRTALDLLGRDELAGLADRTDVAARAVRDYLSFTRRPDVQALLTGGTVYHEVPFAMREGDQLVRGTIDCLVSRGAGELVVIEFKTGRRRAAHQDQAAFYERAAGLIFPRHHVTAHIVYAEDAEATENV
jgi:hypothetical protein